MSKKNHQTRVAVERPLKMHIRWMIRRDMPEVLEIEEQCFEFLWYEEDFIRCLRQRNCIGMVAEHDDRVVGFMIYELYETRIRIINFAVGRPWQRLAVGSQMVAKLAGKLSRRRRNRLGLEVRESNLAAQQFFRDCGFRCVTTVRNFYEDTGEDAYVFRCDVDTGRGSKLKVQSA